ncbi:MAG: radical SAM protein [Syntrophorhabdaceae bacterium]|nr:radical SAM protein [Syntrophorhabdaceae bacterium]
MEGTRRGFLRYCLLSILPYFIHTDRAVFALSEKNRSVKGKEDKAKEFEPSYLKLHRSGELKKRGERLWESMGSCNLCPRGCGVNRLKGEKGFCNANSQLMVSAFHPHFGEEKPITGWNGSGTIFFTHCNLRCVYCINWEINHEGRGEVVTIEQLAEMMLGLQKIGCHNINLVTPTHYSPHILLAADMAAAKGLRLPLLYNSSGWEKLDVLKILDGVVDIYLPDFKYSNGKMASKYSSGADTYPGITKIAISEMHRQVGVARLEKDGLIKKGLIIRHLVLPNNVSGTREVLHWIANNLPKDTYVNLMSQYTPQYKAFQYHEISRKITRKEYNDAIKWAREFGLINLDIQGYYFI